MAVLIGDVVSSRTIEGRARFQTKLKKVTAATNAVAGNRLLSRFTITLGDEVQAVYGAADGLVDHALYYMGGVSPVPMRFAIGVGPLSTPINRKQAIGMDGPAFHAARDGLERQKTTGVRCAIWTAADWAGPDLALADAALQVLSVEVARWRPARWRVVRHLIGGMFETETAAALGIERQAVNEHVRRGAVRTVRNAGRQIDVELTRAVQPR